jgi:hypothetical protein
MEITMQRKKSFFVYASAISVVGVLVTLSATPGIARQVKTTAQDGYQQQMAASSYAYEPQAVAMISRRGQCWIATDASRPFGYAGSCANPLAYDPALSPTYNGELHGD